jgi:hypothetical protein
MCKSFTQEGVCYDVKVSDGYVNFCSCPDNRGICKHIFLVSRVKVLPLNAQRLVTNSSSEPMNITDDEKKRIALADFKDEANKAKRLMMKHIDAVFKTADIPSIEILSHYMKEFIMKSEKLHTNPQARPNKQR